MDGLRLGERELEQRLGDYLLDGYSAGQLTPGDASEFGHLSPNRRSSWQALAVWLRAHPPA